MSQERAENLRQMIASKEQLIQQGVGASREVELQAEVVILQQELDGLQEVAELPPEEVENMPAEEILTNIHGERLEFYTETIAGAILIRNEVKTLIEFEQLLSKEKVDSEREKTEQYKQLYRAEQKVIADLGEKYKDLEEKHNVVVASERALLLENNEIKLTNEDLQSKLTNAGDRIADIEQQLKDALIENNRNRQFTAQTEEEQTAAIEAAKQEIAESIIEVYDTKPKEGEYPSVTLVSKIAKTGEEIEYHYFKKNKYKDIGTEAALAIQAMNAPVEAPEVDEEAIFLEDTSTEESILEGEQGIEQPDSGDNEQTVSEDAEETVAETFEQRTERRLNALELKINRNDLVIQHDLAS